MGEVAEGVGRRTRLSAPLGGEASWVEGDVRGLGQSAAVAAASPPLMQGGEPGLWSGWAPWQRLKRPVAGGGPGCREPDGLMASPVTLELHNP